MLRGGGGKKESSFKEIQVFGAKSCDVQFPKTYFEFKVVLDILTKACTSFWNKQWMYMQLISTPFF